MECGRRVWDRIVMWETEHGVGALLQILSQFITHAKRSFYATDTSTIYHTLHRHRVYVSAGRVCADCVCADYASARPVSQGYARATQRTVAPEAAS